MKHPRASLNKYTFMASSDNGLYLSIRVFPRSGKNELSLTKDKTALKARLTSPPVDNEANKALVALLAKSLKIKKNSIEITSGKKSRNKRVKITDVKKEDMEEALSKLIEAS